MLPCDLQARDFSAYPPQARAIAVANLDVLRQLPLSFLPGFLRELIEYDYKFPAERASIDRELTHLRQLSPAQVSALYSGFSRLTLSSELQHLSWVNHPAQFVEQESAYLWSTHQLDAFSSAATQYGDSLTQANPPTPLPLKRLGIVIIGQGVTSYDALLFRNLRPHGTLFTAVKPDNGLALLLGALEDRAATHPAPYAHWYIDGGVSVRQISSTSMLSYEALQPLRARLLQSMQAQIARPGMGPEALRTDLARLSPADLGMDSAGDPVLDRFKLKLFTEGSGTQIFSTTFAQWATREALRRAQPLTLVVRYAPRQRQRPMNELLANKDTHPELDPVASLVDADMAAYYHWINQQRLAGAGQSSFLVWFEGHQQALVIAPTLPRGSQSASAVDLKQLLTLSTT
jgi:hypothetical protein